MPTWHCSRNAGSRHEGKSWPDVLQYSGVVDRLSVHPRAARTKFGRQKSGAAAAEAAGARSATALVGPGQYRTTRQYPQDEKAEVCLRLSASHDFLYTTFGAEARTSRDGTLKGMSVEANNNIPNPTSPGQYSATDPALSRRHAPSWSVPLASESPDQLRSRKAQAGAPGPGAYDLPDPLEDAGRERVEQRRALPPSARRISRVDRDHWRQLFDRTRPTKAVPAPKAAAAAACRAVDPARMTEKDALCMLLTMGR